MEHIWMFYIFISSILYKPHCQYLFPLSPLPRQCIIMQLLKFASASQFHFLYKPFCSIFLLLSIFVWFSLPPPTPDTVLFWNFLNLHLPHSWQANLGPHPPRQTYHLCQIEFAPSPSFFYCSYWQRRINGWKERNTLFVTCPKNPMTLAQCCSNSTSFSMVVLGHIFHLAKKSDFSIPILTSVANVSDFHSCFTRPCLDLQNP